METLEEGSETSNLDLRLKLAEANQTIRRLIDSGYSVNLDWGNTEEEGDAYPILEAVKVRVERL